MKDKEEGERMRVAAKNKKTTTKTVQMKKKEESVWESEGGKIGNNIRKKKLKENRTEWRGKKEERVQEEKI